MHSLIFSNRYHIEWSKKRSVSILPQRGQTAELLAENIGGWIKGRGLAINVEAESVVFRTHCSSSGCYALTR